MSFYISLQDPALTIAILGLSGVGKSTLCEKLSRNYRNIRHTDASSFLSEKQKNDPVANYTRNQGIISKAVRLRAKQLGSEYIFLISSHSILEFNDNIKKIEPFVFANMGIKALIHLSENPSAIFAERQETHRVRQFQTVENIQILQQESLCQAKFISRTLNIPLLALNERNDFQAISTFLKKEMSLFLK